jgi:hypothetical protein
MELANTLEKSITQATDLIGEGKDKTDLTEVYSYI